MKEENETAELAANDRNVRGDNAASGASARGGRKSGSSGRGGKKAKLDSPRVKSREEVEQLIQQHYGAMLKFARKFCPSEYHVKKQEAVGFADFDVVNAACLKLLRGWRNVRRMPGFLPYAFTCVRRTVSEILNKDDRRERLNLKHRVTVIDNLGMETCYESLSQMRGGFSDGQKP